MQLLTGFKDETSSSHQKLQSKGQIICLVNMRRPDTCAADICAADTGATDICACDHDNITLHKWPRHEGEAVNLQKFWGILGFF